MRQATESGIGRALRKARLHRGLTIEEASRGTRLRPDYLEALEREDFDGLPGDVYVRGFLRSYAAFLGLRAEKVVGVYEQAYGRPAPPPSPVDRAPALAAAGDPELPGARRHLPWAQAAVVAVAVLVVAAGAGLLSRSASTPEPAGRSREGAMPVLPREVTVNLVTLGDVQAKVVADGVTRFSGELEEDEAHSFEAEEEIYLWVARGNAIRLEVNGTDLGRPGQRTRAFEQTFSPQDYRDRPAANGRGGSREDRSAPNG